MIVYGKQIALYILEKFPDKIVTAIFSKEIDKRVFSKFTQHKHIKIEKVDNKKAQALAKGGNHQGFFLELEPFELSTLSQIKHSNTLLILDGITDVGNIGAICRTAYCFGVDAIVVCGVQSLHFDGIIRTSSGSALSLPVVKVTHELDMVHELKQVGFDFIGADMSGESLCTSTFKDTQEKRALVLGSEGRGISPKLAKKLDKKVNIAMHNHFDSLNVSVAAGILLYELQRG